MICSLRCFLIALGCLCWNIAFPQYYFDKLTEENGLSDNRVTCLLKDKTGFLWIGTKNGLNRYDGKTFEIFRPGAGNSISNEEITDIVQDTSGKLWISTLNGLNSYDPRTNRWETKVPTGKRDGIPNYIIWDLHTDQQNRIWIVSDVWELSVFDPASGKIRYFDDWPVFKQQAQFDTFPRYRSIQKMTVKNENEYWLATTIGLFSANALTGKLRFYGAGFSGTVKDLLYDPQARNVYLVTEKGRLFSYNENSGLYAEIAVSSQPYPATRWNRAAGNADKLLMAHPGGMLEINRVSGSATVITDQPALKSSLLPGGTNIIYRDDEGTIWAGTGNGIAFYNSRNQSADFIPLSVSSGKDNTDGMSAAIYDETGDQYFITSLSARAVFIIDRRSGNIRSIKTAEGKTFGPCTNIRRDGQDNIWLLTETNVYRYDRDKERFILFPTPNGKEPVIFHDIALDKQGDYWLATWQGGVYLFNKKERSFRTFAIGEGVSWATTTALLNDPLDSALWIGSFSVGVSRYDLATRQKTIYAQTDSIPEYMQLNLIRDMTAGGDGKIWIATFGAGLYYYQHNRTYDKSLTQISAKDGLPGSSYFAIASNNRDRLWLLSGDGISVADDSGRFLHKAPRHPALSFSNYATDIRYPKRISYNKKHKELLVPVAGGLLIYYPDKPVPPAKYPIVMTGMSVSGRPVIYDPAFTNGDKIEVPYRGNSLSFQFAALNFNAGNETRYEYRLHQNDTAWIPAGVSGAMNFPDLSPGDYTLLVRARDAAGNLSSNVARFDFRVIPPFWKTWWFISFLVLLAAYGVYVWTLYLRRKIKTQQILNYFATSLYGQNTVEDICWDIARNCIGKLQFVDCMVYIFDPQRNVLMQKAAYGPKSPQVHEIINPLEIPLGKGIVGTVAQTGKAEIIKDTSRDSRYIVDDERRYSEITVPIFVDGKIFGIIDSEHPRKNFYKKHHLKLLQDIASICSNKISKYIIEERLRSKISRDLHDEIGSALTSINVLSKVALNKFTDDAEIAGYLHKIQDSTFSTMENMSDIVWAINPKNDKLEAIMSRMKEFAAELCEAQGISLSSSFPAELERLSIDLARRKNLFLVFKESVNNAVKHSGCTAMHIGLEQTGRRIRMTICDNGKGIGDSPAVYGNGLHNMQARAAECGGTLAIQSAERQGTMVVLEIPVPFLGEAPEI